MTFKQKIYAVFGAVALMTLAGCESSPHELRLVSPVSPIDRDIAQDLASLLEDTSSVRVTLTDSDLAEEAALDAVASGEADIALVSNSMPFRQDIATVMPLYPAVLHIARHRRIEATAGPGVFDGATIFAGAEGSASRLVFERFAERIGLDEKAYSYVAQPDAVPDVVVVFAPISPERIAEFPDLILTSMGRPEEIGSGNIVDAAIMLNPNFRPFVIPVGTYGSATPEPIATIAVDKMIVARKDLDSSVIYDLINEILRHRPALAAHRPGIFQQLSEDFDTSRSTFIVHAGTQAYLQRSAPSVLERYSGVAEVAVTLVVALASALFASVRIFKMRRKNRIDRYYAATIDIRNGMEGVEDSAMRQEAIAKVRALQNEAFDLLVHEKLAADESFRIFITLSNDVLRQLGAITASDQLSDS